MQQQDRPSKGTRRRGRNWRQVTAQLGVMAIAAVAVAGALKVAAVFFVPIVVALLLSLLLWPTRRTLARAMPGWLAAVACMLIALVVLAAGSGITAYSGSRAWHQFQASRQQYIEHYHEVRDWLTGWGVPRQAVPRVNSSEPRDAAGDEDDAVGAGVFAEGAAGRGVFAEGGNRESTKRSATASADDYLLTPDARGQLAMLIAGGLRSAAGMIAAALMTIFLLFLALLEGEKWSEWAESTLSQRRCDLLHRIIERCGKQTRHYFFAKTIGGLASGTATWLWLWAMGVPIPFVWGMLTFVLNYLPNVGAFISGLPPTLLALVHLGWWQAGLVLAGLIAIEMLIGNLLDPMIQGDMMDLSTFVVLASLLFWGWLWGIMGALLAPVLTAAIIAAVAEMSKADVPGERCDGRQAGEAQGGSRQQV